MTLDHNDIQTLREASDRLRHSYPNVAVQLTVIADREEQSNARFKSVEYRPVSVSGTAMVSISTGLSQTPGLHRGDG